ncbi:achaete-scute homolog 5 [Dunckerocampus dactyliophorus]|uniref:achaete-scute homolog 5 n=1 Tax=Dunckerocampus dactyliophorus TaxID=161453 RepID=UPI0024050D91|nr:achaete-scute homolog 5 [Dunckerocampus dactyliophorus]
MDFAKGPLKDPPRVLLPFLSSPHQHLGVLRCPLEVLGCPTDPAFVQRRNERERSRVKCVNAGYARLRQHLPAYSATRRLTKVETLRAAISYIKYLRDLLVVLENESTGSQQETLTCLVLTK